GPLGAGNQGRRIRRQRGHGKGERDAMIARGIDRGASQRASAVDAQAIGKLLHLRAHRAQPAGHLREAVGFLHAQLARSADDRRSGGHGAEHGEDGNLVDGAQHQLAVQLGAAQLLRRSRQVRGRLAAGAISAAASRNAAEERSPGTSSAMPESRAGPRTDTVVPRTATGTPICRSIRSVWSRLRAGSVKLVSPSAKSPASSTALFTWALATSDDTAPARTAPPLSTTTGGCPPSPVP